MIRYIIVPLLILLSLLVILFITLKWWVLTILISLLLVGTLYEIYLKITYILTVEVALKDITPTVPHENVSLNSLSDKKKNSPYDWGRLTDSIKKNGVRFPLIVRKLNTDNYVLIDGNHRLRVLKELYGEEYKIKVRVMNKKYKRFIK